MRKFLTILVCGLLLGGTALSQPRAIGIRTGWGHELSFQYSFLDTQFLQLDLGTVGFYPEGARLTGTYNYIFSKPQWTPRGDWAWYAGFGATIGMRHSTVVAEPDREKVDYNYLLAGAVGHFGLEYNFWFPLQLSLDLRPIIGVAVGRGPAHGFYTDGIGFGFIPALSARYKF